MLAEHVFASLDVALEKVGDVVGRLHVRFLGEVFSLTENVNERSGALVAGGQDGLLYAHERTLADEARGAYGRAEQSFDENAEMDPMTYLGRYSEQGCLAHMGFGMAP